MPAKGRKDFEGNLVAGFRQTCGMGRVREVYQYAYGSHAANVLHDARRSPDSCEKGINLLLLVCRIFHMYQQTHN